MAGRIRSIKPELLDDEIAAGLSDAAWRLFVSSWLLADDQGGFRASPRYLAALVWQDTTRDALAPLLELAVKGRIYLYEVDGQLYAVVPTWTRHQRVDNAGKPRVPPPPTNIREVSANLAASLRGSPLGPKSSPLDLRPRSPTTITEQRDVRFENPPPSGARLSSAFDPEHIAEPAADCPARALAPVGPEEMPVPATGSGLDSPDDTTDASAPMPDAADLTLRQPEPPATVSPADHSPDAAHVAPLPETSNPKPLALPFALEPVKARHDPVEAIFAEYLAAWRRVMKGRRPPKLEDKRRKLTLLRLREFTEDDLKAAARGVFASTWNIENKQTDYDLVMRDAKHVEKFMACDEDSRPQSASTEKPAWMNQLPRRTITLRDVEALAADEPDWNENLAPIAAPETP